MNQYYNQNPQPYGYGYPPQGPAYAYLRKPVRSWANGIGLGLVLVQPIMTGAYLLVYWLFSLPVFWDLPLHVKDLIDQSTSLFAYCLGFWVPILVILNWIKIPPDIAFPMKRPRMSIAIPAVFVCLGASVIGMLSASVVSAFFESAFGLIPSMPEMEIPKGIAANVVYVISIVVAPAIFEEMLFRRVIMQSLRRFGDSFAVVVSARLFGLIHGNLIQGPNAFITGLVIGYFVLRTGSLVTGMVIHSVNNCLSIVFSYMMEYMTDLSIEALNLTVLGVYLLLGAMALVYLAVKHGNLFRLFPGSYPLPAATKYGTFFFTSCTQILFMLGTVLLTAMYFE